MKKDKLNKIIIIGIAVITVLIIIALSWYLISIKSVKRMKKNSKEAAESIEITIPLGTGKSEIADLLEENKLIKSKLAFKIYVKLNKVSNFQAGTYYLNQYMNIKEICNTLQTGIMYDPNQINITYIEGKNIRNLAKVIAEKTNNTEEDVFNKLKDKDYINELIEKYWFLSNDIKNKDIYYSLEGYLFPDTYTITNEDATVEEIFEKMLDRMDNVLSEYKNEIENSEYSLHEILTIASIIETESTTEESRKDVASVIYNRLNKGMAIQSDVTTYYAIKVDVDERDLYQKEIDAYNAYNTRGPNMEGKLPVGPIASVSKTSIEAALKPNNTKYLYFIADKNGKTYFTKTNDEHNEKINELKSSGLWFEY